MIDEKRFAPPNTIWVCAACGKTHTDRFGLEGQGDFNWDESCALNAILCHAEQRIDLRTGLSCWTPVKDDNV